MRRLLLTLFLLGPALLHTSSSLAFAQVDAQISELNSQALEAYQALDIDTARGKLEQAIGLAQQAGMGGPLVAQTYMNLGVVYVAGMNDRDHGLTAFVSAMCMQPDVQLDPLLSTPDVQQVFAQAQQDARSGACGPVGPPQQGGPPPMMMPPQGGAPSPGMAAQYGSAGPRMDVECPPGVKCNGGGGEEGPGDFARGFVDLQFDVGLSWVGSGMKADSKPKNLGEVLTTQTVPVQVNQDVNMDGMIDMNDTVPMMRQYFNQSSAWVPDADSFDDYETPDGVRGITPIGTNCKADGKRTGPTDVVDMNTGMNFTTIEPSSYCVRVEHPGFIPSYAMRLTPGYWITKSFALSVPLRIQFSAGQGTLSHILVGLRGELMLNHVDSATGFPISWFFGATAGQIQVKPPTKDPTRASPFVISGPVGVHTGMNFRFRVQRNFGFIVGPEFDFLFPNVMFAIDLTAGVEGAF